MYHYTKNQGFTNFNRDRRGESYQMYFNLTGPKKSFLNKLANSLTSLEKGTEEYNKCLVKYSKLNELELCFINEQIEFLNWYNNG